MVNRHLLKYLGDKSPTEHKPRLLDLPEPLAEPTDESMRHRLAIFYAQVRPEKIDEMDLVLSTYRGRYNKLIKILQRKYQTRFPDGEEHHGQLPVTSLLRFGFRVS